MEHHTYFSNQEWAESDPVTLITKLHQLTDEYVVEISDTLHEAHGVIVSYKVLTSS